MTFKVSASPNNKYILIKVKGDITRRLALEYNLEAHKLGTIHGIHRFLMDVTDARNVESAIENYNFAYRDMKKAAEINRTARVALLVSPSDHSHDFLETVTRNAGLDVTLFRNRKQAEHHLKAA